MDDVDEELLEKHDGGPADESLDELLRIKNMVLHSSNVLNTFQMFDCSILRKFDIKKIYATCADSKPVTMQMS